jgi:acyl transferase domain-containing protein
MNQGVGYPPLAIIGMACRLPGANNLDDFWRLLAEGRSMVAEVPPERLDRQLHYDPRKGQLAKTYSTLACLIDYPQVDLTRCGLREEDRDKYDLAHLTLVDVAAEACRHAGYDPGNLPQRHAGVYIGHTKGSELGGQIAYGTIVPQTAQYLR